MKLTPAAVLGALLLPVFVTRAEPVDEPQKQTKPTTPPARKEEMKHRLGELKKVRDEWFSKDHGEKKDGHPGPMSDEMRKKLSGFRAEIEELHKAGKHQEADALRDKLAGQLMDGREQHHRKGAEVPVEERLGHISEAIKHLRAAGMHEMASSLEKAAAQMREQMKEPKHRDGADDEIRALREQMEKLKHTVEELRGQLHKAAPQDEVRKPGNP